MERIGDSLHHEKKYNDASLAYEKAIYFNSNPVTKAKLALKRAQSLKQINSFDIAEQTLSRVDLNWLPDSLVYEVKYNAALCSYLGSNFALAESHLIQLIYFGKDSVQKPNCYPLYTLILNELGKYEQAKNYLDKYIQQLYAITDTNRIKFLAEANTLYSKQNQPKLKRMKKAKTMSAIIPGLGQMYAGYWGEGITAMTCNALFIGLTGVGIYTKYYVTSALYSYSIFAKFYSGNISRVEFLVNKKNYQMLKNHNANLKQKIIAYWK
jgi:TM2 domain-containing membrane protein YozV